MKRWSAVSALYAVLIYAFIYLPVAVLALFSLQESQIPVPPFNGPSLKWFGQILSNSKVTGAMWNSLAVAVISSAICVVLAFLAAYGLSRFKPKGGRFLAGLLIAPLAVSYLIIGMGLLITINAIGMRPSLVAAGLGHVVINMPLCFAIIFSQMGDHHINIERAARDLGARSWQVLLLVTAPVLWPALFASFFLAMTLSWDEFIIAFLLTRFETTLPVEIWNILRSGLSPRANAIGTLVFIVSAVIVVAVELIVFRRGKNERAGQS